MNRKIYYWKLRDSEMQLGERTLIMGVLNVTPDSFSDGGRFNDPDRAYARALELEEQGADIIDIGAESTKPGSTRITADEEWQRLVGVLKRLRGNLRVPLSLDTYKSEIAERALEYGVEIINDPTGLTFDPNLAKVAATGNAGLILNHMRGQPESWAKLAPMKDPLGMITKELEATASRARLAGVERGRIVIDPGLGFGKRKEQNAEILAHLKQLATLDYPILVGPSKKSFLAKGSEVETLYATAAAVAAAVLNGAHIVRVHDVKEMQSVVQVAEEIARAAEPKVVPIEPERPAARGRAHSGPNFEAERPRPTRPPMAKPAVVVPIHAQEEAPEEVPAEVLAETQAEAEIEAPPAEQKPEPRVEKAAEDRPVRKYARPKDAEQASRGDSRPARPTRPSYGDRGQGDGSRPPARPFTPRRPADKSGPPRGRDFRPGQDSRSEYKPAAGSDRFSKPAGSKGPYSRDGERRDDRPPRQDRGDYRPSSGPRSGPPRSDFERSGPPRSGPPRSGPPRSGPPRSDFQRSGPPRSGPPRSGPPRSGPPRPRDDDRPRSGGFKPSGPPRSFDRGGDSRDSRPSRSGPPRSGPPRSGPPRGRDDRPDRGPSGPPQKRPFRKRP